MAIFKLNNLSEEEKKKYYNNLQNKIDNDFEGEKQRAIDINQASTIQNNQQVNNVPSQQNNNASVWNKMQWLMKKYVNSAQSSVTNTVGSVPQSMAVGYNRAEEQAKKEQNIFDRLNNISKNAIKTVANDPISKLLYNLTLGRDEYLDRLKEQASQLNDNFNKAEGVLNKTGTIIGGLTSNVLTENNPAVQQAYNTAQLNGSVYGEDYSKKQKEKMLELDENINKDAEKWSEELEKEGENYGKVTKFLGNASGSIGYMTPSILLTALTGGGSGAQSIGMAQMGLSAKGQATRQGLKEGLDIESADRKGVASGSAEVGSEFMFNGLKAFKTFKNNGVEEFARNWIEKSVENKIKSELGQKVTKGVGNWLVDVTGESIEELTTDIYNTWLDRATTNPNKEYTLEDATNTVLSTILSTTGLNAGNKVINTALNNDENANQQEYKKVVEENLKSQPQSTQNEQILPTQQVNQEQNNVAQNGNTKQILPTQNNVKEDNLKGRSFEDIVDDAMSNYEYNEIPSPLKDRDINTIGKETKVNAYQYDNPKVKPYFQQMAEMIGEDIGNIASPDNRKTQKGGGTVLNTNIPAIKQLKEMGYSYDQIVDGIVNIIDDHGKENNALSKKLEIIIDDQLRNGYTNSYGKYISPNEEYINLINNDIPKQNNIEQNENTNQILPTQNKVVITNNDNLMSSAKKYNLNYKDLSIENSQKALEKRGIKARFDEIDAIVIPNDLSNEVKQQLKDRGIKTIEYDRNNENEKADIIKSLDEYKFSNSSESFDQYLENRIGKEGTRTSLKDLKLPTKQNILQVKENNTNKTKVNESNMQKKVNLPTKGETIAWNEISNTDKELNGNIDTEKKVAKILTEPVEKVKEKNRTWAILKANLIDKGIVFEELSRKAKNRELQGKYDYTLTANARGQYAIGNARYDGDTQISKSLTDIIDEVGENAGDFYKYMYHQLNIDRMTLEDRYGGDTGLNYERKNKMKNKPVFGDDITAQMSKNEVADIEKKHPEFKKYAQDVYDYLDANKKELVDKGVISQETSDLFKEMYPHYVPIQRVGENGNSINVPLDTGRTGINSPIKKAKGGSTDIAPLFETMADKTLQTYRASARNNFGVELKNTLAKVNQLNQVSDIANIDTIMENITDEQQNNELLQQGKNGNDPTFTVFENGKKVTFDISQDMYNALKPKDSSSILSKTFKIPNKISSFHRGVLTEYNPVFSITNAIKDAQDVVLNSQHPVKTYAKFPEAYTQIIGKGHWYQEYIQNGGEQNSYFKDGQFDKPKANLPTKAKKVVTFPLKAISSINNVIEMSPRLAEYIASREKGASIETAMLDASRVTTNFKAGGDVTKFLNRNGATFLNASVQGFQQQVRNIQEANAKGLKGYAVLLTKYAIAGIPALILNGIIWKDDEDYEKLQDYVKDNYYCIAKMPNGDFIRIPKGRVSATIQKIVSNATKFIKDGKINADDVGKEFWNDLKEDVKFAIDNVAPNNPIDNNIFAPITQVINNKTWYGSDLVPSRLKKLPAEEQFDESTDKLSKWLGEKIGFSPYKINYLINQYSGGVGDVLLPIGTPQAENNVIQDKFTANPILKNKYPGQFFEKVEELNVSNNSSKANDTDKVKYKYASEIQNEISDLYKQERDIQNSSDTDKVKKDKILEIQKKINKLAENGLKDIDNIKVTGDTAQINNKEYYKATNLKNGTKEWKELSDEEKAKKKEISLKTYANYKEDIAKETIKQRKSGNIKEDGQLNDNSKIDILLSTKYTDKEKALIYENFILSRPKEDSLDTYKVIKSSNMNINEYLKYKQQEFVSDREDDGTLNGKTVKSNEEGSKKNKFVKYINSMNITGNQRLLLYAMQGYSMDSSQKKQLVNYVQNLDIDKSTKLKLYNRFSGFTTYKDGTIKY